MLRILILIMTILTVPRGSHAAASIVINEFQTTTPQQVELYNNGTVPVDISGWYIDDNGGATYYTISDDTFLNPNQCLSFSSSFGLNTSSPDSVRLFDSTAPPTATNAHIVDIFGYDKISDASKNFQRIPDGSSIWVAGAPSINHLNLNGVPCTPPPTPTATPSPTRTPTPTKTPMPTPTHTESHSAPSTYDNVFITEVLPNPQAGQNEWVELYNANSFQVTLENWFIDDVLDAGANPYKFFLTVPANSYAVVDLPNALFNNDGDSIRLLDRNEIQKDSITYQSVKEAHSINRNSISSTAVCLASPTRAAANNSCLTAPVTPTTAPATGVTGDEASEPGAVDKPSAQQGVVRGAAATASKPKSGGASQLSDTPDAFGESAEVMGMAEFNPLINGMFITSILSSLLTIFLVFFKMKTW